jgi:hypothetical protein
MRSAQLSALAAGTLALLLMAGCHVNEHNNGDGKDVNISTPFGGLKVDTNQPDVLAEIGLPAYPGAQPVKKDNDDNAADVNMTFGGFHLRVKATRYKTSDAPSKVQAFYANALKRYGDVITCRGTQPVGKPDHTQDGLTCDDHDGKHITVADDPEKHDLDLKTGSRQHQRIVSIMNDSDGGTTFGLVVLDLPGHVSNDQSDDTRQ